jgi:thiol-disulfide isomerase/thioredoxin
MKRIAAFIVITVLFGCITVYLLQRGKKKTISNTPIVGEFFYFYTAWCPYCKKAFVEWNKFKSEWNYKTLDGYTLKFQEVDCDINEALASKYNVDTYPTIKLVKDGVVIDYDAKPTLDSLTLFLSTNF